MTPEEWRPSANVHGDPKRKVELTDVAYLEYRKWPDHIPNWNQKDPRYVYSERDEIHLQHSIDGHNWMID